MVSLKHIRNIGDTHLVLSNSVVLPYSQRQRTAILQAFREYLATRAKSHEAISWKLDFSEEFSCFLRCPFPFLVMEIDSDRQPWEAASFLVRWANEPFASLIRMPLHRLIHAPLPVWVFAQDKDVPGTLARIALSGGTAEWYEHPYYYESRQMHICCYQPHFGFCACLIVPTDG